jgi:hypothetical protein
MQSKQETNGMFNMSKLNNQQLLKSFNDDLEHADWTASRSEFHVEMTDELERRGIDSTKIRKDDKLQLSKDHQAFLFGNKICIEKEHSPETSIEIQYKNGEQVKLKVQTIFLDEAHFSLKNYKKEVPLFLIIRHDQLQTHIDATGLVDHRLAAFDQQTDFTSISILHSDSSGTFALLTQARFVLVFHTKDLEQIQGIQSVSID